MSGGAGEMEFYIQTGEKGGADAVMLIRRIAAVLPLQPTVVTPCFWEDWHMGLGHLAALQRWEPQWERQLCKGDQCLLLDLMNEDLWQAAPLRHRGVAVLGWLEGPTLHDRQYRRRLRQCDAVLTADLHSYEQGRRYGLRRIFLLAAENRPTQQ